MVLPGASPQQCRAELAQAALVILLRLAAGVGGVAAGQAVASTCPQGCLLPLRVCPGGSVLVLWLGIVPLAEKLPQQRFWEDFLKAFTSPFLCAQLGVMQIQLQDHIHLEGESKGHKVNQRPRLETELFCSVKNPDGLCWLFCRLTAPCCGVLEQCCCHRR